jgi:hypothetical protein
MCQGYTPSLTRGSTAISTLHMGSGSMHGRACATHMAAAGAPQIVNPAGILASNTSSISITRIAAVTERPDRVVGLPRLGKCSRTVPDGYLHCIKQEVCDWDEASSLCRWACTL